MLAIKQYAAAAATTTTSFDTIPLKSSLLIRSILLGRRLSCDSINAMAMFRSCLTHCQSSRLSYCIDRQFQLHPSCLRRGIDLGIRGLAQKNTILRNKPKLQVKPSQSKPSASPKVAPYESLNNKLARSKSPTLLYQAASPRQVSALRALNHPLSPCTRSVLHKRLVGLHLTPDLSFAMIISCKSHETDSKLICSISLAAIL